MMFPLVTSSWPNFNNHSYNLSSITQGNSVDSNSYNITYHTQKLNLKEIQQKINNSITSYIYPKLIKKKRENPYIISNSSVKDRHKESPHNIKIDKGKITGEGNPNILKSVKPVDKPPEYSIYNLSAPFPYLAAKIRIFRKRKQTWWRIMPVISLNNLSGTFVNGNISCPNNNKSLCLNVLDDQVPAFDIKIKMPFMENAARLNILKVKISRIVTDATTKDALQISVDIINKGLNAQEFLISVCDCPLSETQTESTTTVKKMLLPYISETVTFLLPLLMGSKKSSKFTCDVVVKAFIQKRSKRLDSKEPTNILIVSRRSMEIESHSRCFCVWNCRCHCIGKIETHSDDNACQRMNYASEKEAGLLLNCPTNGDFKDFCSMDLTQEKIIDNFSSNLVYKMLVFLALLFVLCLLVLYCCKCFTPRKEDLIVASTEWFCAPENNLITCSRYNNKLRQPSRSAIRCQDLSSNCSEPMQIAALIEAQSIARIVNNQKHWSTANNPEAGDLRTNVVVFDGMNDNSKSSKEPFPVTYASTSATPVPPALTSGQYHYSANSVIVTKKVDYVSTASYNVPDIHIHHHHYVISKGKTNPPAVQYSNIQKSPENEHFQSLPDTLRPNVVVAPDLYNLKSDGHYVESNYTIENESPNSLNIAQFEKNAPDTFNDVQINLRSEHISNPLGDVFDNNTDRILDLSPIAIEDHIADVSSTSAPAENENSEYGVPLN
ncbi:hypothetical protein ACLKA7_008334 [Drosophila subpalustris]